MSGYHVGAGSSGVSVRLVTPPNGPRKMTNNRRGAPPAKSSSARSLTAWIIRAIMFATAGFALLDLYLLASSVRH